MKTKLEILLEIHEMDLFMSFLRTFSCQAWDLNEGDRTTPHRTLYVRYRPGDSGPYERFSIGGFSHYAISKSSLEQITHDFERFINLKVFL